MKLNELSTSQMSILGAESINDLLSHSSNAVWFKEDTLSSEKKEFIIDGFKTVKKFDSSEETVRVSFNNGESHMSIKAYAKALAGAKSLEKDVTSISFSTKQVANPSEFQTFTANAGKENESRYVAHELVDLVVK